MREVGQAAAAPKQVCECAAGSSHYRCSLAFADTCSPASDYIRCIRTRVFKRQTTRYVENIGKRSHSLPASLAPLEIKNHASAMYWFKPLTFACHRIPEKNGHIKVITSAYATLTCPFSPGMG